VARHQQAHTIFGIQEKTRLMKNNEINKVFKQHLKAFSSQVINTNGEFVKEIEECETNEDLLDLLKDNAEYLFKVLNGDCSFCDSKDNEIDELEDKVSELEDVLNDVNEEKDDMESELVIAYVPQSLNDEYKLEAFRRNVDRFSVEEIESLLDK
jgi:hypothetical protein